MEPGPHGEPTTAVLKDRMDAAMAAIRAAEAILLAEFSRYIQAGGCKEDGARNPSDWAGYAYGLTAARAQQYAATAEAVARRPGLAAALADGRLNADRVAAVARRLDAEEAATRTRAQESGDETPDQHSEAEPADVDDDTVEAARGASVRDLERAARRAQRTSREEAVRQRNRSEVHLRRSRDGHLLFLRGIFAGADAATVEAALSRLAKQVPDDPQTGKPLLWPHRLALALLIMAKISLGADADPDRATIVVHAREGDAARLANRTPLADDTFSRLLCDARIQALIHDADGKLIAASKVLRTFPPWLRRRIAADAPGCEFPSCTQEQGYCEYHHVERYDGTNTVHRCGCRLCLTHHWLVHEGGWTLKGDRISGFKFFKPNGTLFTPGQPPPQPATDGADPAQRLQTILRHLLDQTRRDIHDDEGRPNH